MNLTIVPEIGKLPVFVRAGSIVPIAPVVQSTAIHPVGPLTLRVYPGKQCGGDLYMDDGNTYEYQHGAYLRVHYECQATPGGLILTIGPRQGSYPAWWKEIHVEIFGWTGGKSSVLTSGKSIDATIDSQLHRLSLNVEDNGNGIQLKIR